MSRPSEVYVRPLTEEEQQWVQHLYHHTTDAMLKTRCHILLLSVQRYNVPQIATLLFYSENMVADTINQFNRSGLQGIIPQPKGGRPAKLTEEFLKKLLDLLESDPRDLGYGFSSWTAGLLAVVLAEQTGVEVSESCVRRYGLASCDLSPLQGITPSTSVSARSMCGLPRSCPRILWAIGTWQNA